MEFARNEIVIKTKWPMKTIRRKFRIHGEFNFNIELPTLHLWAEVVTSSSAEQCARRHDDKLFAEFRIRFHLICFHCETVAAMRQHKDAIQMHAQRPKFKMIHKLIFGNAQCASSICCYYLFLRQSSFVCVCICMYCIHLVLQYVFRLARNDFIFAAAGRFVLRFAYENWNFSFFLCSVVDIFDAHVSRCSFNAIAAGRLSSDHYDHREIYTITRCTPSKNDKSSTKLRHMCSHENWTQKRIF